MKILIIGNEGYIGPLLIKYLKTHTPDCWVAGFDTGFFTHCITAREFPERYVDVQYRGDVREFPLDILNRFDAVIYLAAISNDPMGNRFEQVTYEVNQDAAVKIATACQKSNVHHFAFASSCSVYGAAGDHPRNEQSTLNPLTAYAKSKIHTEHKLQKLAGEELIVTSLRFATACGFSPRVRLDLVLNDFVASTLSTHKIEILSDGTPMRPLIHVQDMSRLLVWASKRKVENGGHYLVANAGSNEWNYMVKDLAQAVQDVYGAVKITINTKAQPDKRSYQVDFSLLKELAGEYAPKVTINEAIHDLYHGLQGMNFSDDQFRSSNLMRLNVLNGHIGDCRLNNQLRWI